MEHNNSILAASSRPTSMQRPNPTHTSSSTAAHGAHASFAERRARADQEIQNVSFLRNGDMSTTQDTGNDSDDEGNTTKRSIMREITREPPGGPRPRKMISKPELTKQRSHFFETAFSSGRDGGKEGLIRDQLRGQAIVVAELKTNVIIESEYNTLNDLTAELAERYNRPAKAIVVTIQHGACMSFSGSFEPAYVLEIYAPPVELQPVTNKRNAALLTRHMNSSLGVLPQRAFVRFVPTPDENHAIGGRTLAGIIDEAIAEATEAMKGMSLRGLHGSKKNSSKHKASNPLKLPRLRESTSSANTTGEKSGPRPAANPNYRGGVVPERKAKRTKSFMALLFGKTDGEKHGSDDDDRRRLSSTS